MRSRWSKSLISWVLLVCGLPFPAAEVPWPKDRPKPPMEYLGPEAVQGVALDGVAKAGELSAAWAGKAKVGSAFQALGKAGDLNDIQKAWRAGDKVKALGQLTWMMIKHGCPPADAADFAGKTVAAGLLSGKDFVNKTQLEDTFRSYKAAGGRGEYGYGQGFLSRELRLGMRTQFPGIKDAELDRMEAAALRTYCENRLYRDRFEEFKGQVRQWLGKSGVRWSGDEASLEHFLALTDQAEKTIEARGAGAGLVNPARIKLAQALFKGQSALEAALAEYFSSYYGDVRDARGNKLDGGQGAAPAAGKGFFRLSKVIHESKFIQPVPGRDGAYEFSRPIYGPGHGPNSRIDFGNGVVLPAVFGSLRVHWEVPMQITPGQPATFRIQGEATYKQLNGTDDTFIEQFGFLLSGNGAYGLGGIALWRIGNGPKERRFTDADSFDLLLPVDIVKRARVSNAKVTLKFRTEQPSTLRFTQELFTFAATRNKDHTWTVPAYGIVYPDQASELSQTPKATSFVVTGPVGSFYEYLWVP